jgi:hypothetical protein
MVPLFIVEVQQVVFLMLVLLIEVVEPVEGLVVVFIFEKIVVEQMIVLRLVQVIVVFMHGARAPDRGRPV